MVKVKNLDNFNFKNKLVIVRSDLNSEVVNGKVINNPRISESAKTIKELKRKKAKVIVLAHQSRKGKKDFISLKQHCKLLRKYVRIKFVGDVIGDVARKKIEGLRAGKAILLENIRFLDEEFKPSKNNNIIKFFESVGVEIYVNDAFSVSHRKQTSLVSFPEKFPSCVGRTMQREIESLEKIKLKDCLYIIGGNKTEEAMMLLGKNKVLVGGTLASLCLISEGKRLGFEDKYLRDSRKYLPKIKRNLSKVILPLDLGVDVNGKRKDLKIKEFPCDYKVKDIGLETTELYEKEISNAKNIFVKGIPGLCDKKEFCIGTKRILKAVEKSGAFSVFSGGSTVTAMKKFGIKEKKIGYVSLSGGATVYYLTNKKIPGLEALKKNKIKVSK